MYWVGYKNGYKETKTWSSRGGGGGWANRIIITLLLLQ